MAMDAARLREEARRAVREVSAFCGLDSRWSGRVLIARSARSIEEAYAWVNNHFDIVVHAWLLHEPVPVILATLYHEAAHTVTAADSLERPEDFVLEETFAEIIARATRRRRLRRLPGRWSRRALRRCDRSDAYSPMVADFRRLCRRRSLDPIAMAVAGIAVRPDQRPAMLSAMGLPTDRFLERWKPLWTEGE